MHRNDERVIRLNSDEFGLIDLSNGGIAFLSSIELKPETDVIVEFENVVIQSSVVYCNTVNNGYRIGIKFVTMDSMGEITLENIVNNYSKGIPYNCEIRQKKTEVFQ